VLRLYVVLVGKSMIISSFFHDINIELDMIKDI